MHIELDRNGNTVLVLSQIDIGDRGFAIQTNGNLPAAHAHGHGRVRTGSDAYGQLKAELIEYVKTHGTDSQRSKLAAAGWIF